MSTNFVYGYELTVKYKSRIIKGLETVGLKITPVYESILLKENMGVEEQIPKESDMVLSCAGKAAMFGGEESNLTHADFEEIRTAALTGETVAFVYGRFNNLGSVQGSQMVTGSGNLSNWSENSGSEKTPVEFSFDIVANKGTVMFSTP